MEIRKNLDINTSGKNGRNGARGQNGIHGMHSGACGGAGFPGLVGENGQASTNINLTLVSQEGDQKILMKGIKEIENAYAKLGNKDFSLRLISVGGLGGTGGDGGRGGDGSQGSRGMNATRYSYGTNGGPGGDGGNGGIGGNGGRGGDGGYIVVNASQYDADLLMLIDEYQINGGLGGVGGNGGMGGRGGPGGPGGSSYSWTTTSRDRNGNTRTHFHHNPGGSRGSNGVSGINGCNGIKGMKGSDGKFQIMVTDENKMYQQRYELQIQSAGIVTSDDGIIEPGEVLYVPYIDFQNIGQMKTPQYQRLDFTLQSNNRIFFDQNKDTIPYEQQIASQQVARIENLKFQIVQNLEPSIDKPFTDTAIVDYRSTVTRVNKQFKLVTKHTDSYEVRYPVEISRVIIAPSVKQGEEAPIVIGLKNISNQAVGLNSDFKSRLLRVFLKYDGGVKDVKFKFKHQEHNKLESEMQKFDFDQFIDVDLPVSIIEPQQVIYFSGTIEFSNPDTAPYSKINFKFDLDLGHINKMDSEFQTIQTNTCSLQLTESYQYNPNALFLLVINSETSKQCIDAWKKFAGQIGTTASVWNIANYGGFLFSHPSEQYNTLFYNLLKDKIVIFLNNDYKDIDQSTKNSIQLIGEREIYKAAKIYGISTYIISSLDKCSFFNQMTPLDNQYDQQDAKDFKDAVQQQKRLSVINRQKRLLFNQEKEDFINVSQSKNEQKNTQIHFYPETSGLQIHKPLLENEKNQINQNQNQIQEVNQDQFNYPQNQENQFNVQYPEQIQNMLNPIPQQEIQQGQAWGQNSQKQNGIENTQQQEINIQMDDRLLQSKIDGKNEDGNKQQQIELIPQMNKDFSEEQALIVKQADEQKQKGKQDALETLKKYRKQFADTYVPLDNEIQISQEEKLIFININQNLRKYRCCSKPPKESDLILEAGKLLQQLENKIAISSFYLVYNYNPTLIKGSCSSNLYDLGEIQIREGLPIPCAYIAQKDTKDHNNFNQEDKYVIFKLLGFYKKMELLKYAMNNDSLDQLIQAILTDLIDEYMGFFYYESEKKFRKMANWNTFKLFDFSQFSQQKGYDKFYYQMKISMIQLQIYLSLCKTSFCCASPTEKLATFLIKIVQNVLKTEFDYPIKEQQKELSSQLKNYKKMDKKMARENIQKPEFKFQNKIFFNHTYPHKKIFSRQEFPIPQDKQSCIQEFQYKFMNSKLGFMDEQMRIKKIEDFEKMVKF